MNTILQAYARYCNFQRPPVNPIRAVQAERWLAGALLFEFPNSMEQYTKLTQDMLKIRAEVIGSIDPEGFQQFRTSGTMSGTPRTYRFGPNAQRWIGTVWQHFTRVFNPRTIVRLRLNGLNDNELTCERNNEGLYQYEARCGVLNKQRTEALVIMLSEMLIAHPQLTLYTTPDAYLYLNQHLGFKYFALLNKDKVNYLSGLWEPFFKRDELRANGVWFGNIMIDWTTGVNFFTCSASKQHTLPIFALTDQGPTNLLNLAPDQPQNASDRETFTALNVVKCACGQYRLAFKHLPHPESAMRQLDGTPVYDPGLVEKLRGHYRHMQFRQSGNVVTIGHLTEDGSFPDKDMLTDYFQTRGFEVNYEISTAPFVCGKRPVFLKTTASVESAPGTLVLPDQSTSPVVVR